MRRASGSATDRRGHVEVLPLAEAEADLDGEVGELVEFGGVDRQAW